MRTLWGSLFDALLTYRTDKPALYAQYMQQLSTFLQFLMKACVKKCTVSVDYLQHYATITTTPTIITAVEEDKEDGQVSDTEDDRIVQMNEQYETKRETRSHVKEIIEHMTKSLEPK